MLVTFYLGFDYDNTFSQKAIKNCISMIGEQFKTVKLYSASTYYSFRTDLFCENSTLVKETFMSVIKEMNKARALLSTIVSFADIDLSDHEAVFAKAKKLYLDDEDDKSFVLFKMLADAGYENAYGYLGESYQYGYGVEKNYSLMRKWYQKAIDKGYMWCANKLANYQFSNEEYEDAFKNYMRFVSNESTNKCDALYRIGYMQEKGLGTEKNLEKAIASYRKSVQYSTDLECDARIALMRLKEIVENENEFVDATRTMLMGLTPKQMYDTGYEYENGLNKRFVSLPKAYGFFKAAADAGYTEAISKMGEIYISKYYPFKDKNKSDKFYQKAFKIYKQKEKNNGDACYELGRMYENGWGVNNDKEQAKFYYKSGALLGDINASWRFGLICKDELDYTEAAKFFKKAAEGGQGMAMYELAACYEEGMGVPTSREKAIEWYEKCAQSKYVARNDAKKALKRLGAVGEKE